MCRSAHKPLELVQQMATAPHMNPDLSKLGDELYKHWEGAMTSWWDQVLESPSFLGAMGQNLEGAARARGQYERSVDDTMEKMHLPTRSDVVRVAKIAAMLEERLLQQEDLVLELKDQLGRLERETIQARIEAAEARLELRDTLAALRSDLRVASGTPAAVAPPTFAAIPPTAPRTRKAGA
ncbi:hypothetical protein LBMAG42_57250 [Deltaproteobacteria bacterium]|nr:hypothetical protein LBMAG42_57250 [Deltaproteobacteria bacterium]